MRTQNRTPGTAARLTAISAGLVLASFGSIGSAAATTTQFTVDKQTVAVGETFLVTFPGCTANTLRATTGAAIGTMDQSYQWAGYRATPDSANGDQDAFRAKIDKPGTYNLRGGCAYLPTAGGEYSVIDYGYVTVTVTAPAPADLLAAGAELKAGESITQAGHKLVMQGDGNLVAYNAAGKAVWSSGTSNNPGAKAAMQSDGNFVVYSAAGKALWQSGTSGNAGAEVRINAEGIVGVYVGDKGPLWSNAPKVAAANELAAGKSFVAGQELVSTNGTYKLAMQGDGNMVVYKGNTPLWQSGTGGNTGARAEFRNGNLVVVDAGGTVKWASNTTAGAKVVVQDDGNTVVYPTSGGALWQSGTAGR